MSLAKRTLDLIEEIVEEYIEELGADENPDDIPEEVEFEEVDPNSLKDIEEVKFKKVVRKGVIKKIAICRDGYKYDSKKKQCVKMSIKEIKARSRSAKLSSRKRKAKAAQAARKRKLSMKKAQRLG